MSLEVVYGESRNRHAAVQLAEALKTVVSQGTVYLAYPVLATSDDRVEVDALLVSREHGLVAFLIAGAPPATRSDWNDYREAQDRLYNVLESHLGRHASLRTRRKLAFEIHTATVFSALVGQDSEQEGFYGNLDQLQEWVGSLEGIGESIEQALQAALQRVTTIKPPKKRAAVRQASSRGATIKLIEQEIANLDQWQKAAAIETPEGPQRIRGLAGSGKTVVLSLKAAYLHALNPEWKIAFTFSTRALQQQVNDLVTRFSFEHSNDQFDSERLQILPSWGSITRPGVYSQIAMALGLAVRDYNYARATYGVENAFQGVCQELLAVAMQVESEPIFDAVLIDEAQDLPPEFFQLVYRFTKEPKRIMWGFDELQKLSESAMPGTDELFGKGPNGESLVSLANREGEARRDITLPICYRNTPWALATAHALGVGVYRTNGLLQHPDDPNLWEDIGYEVVRGTPQFGEHVALQRRASSYPKYFNDWLNPNDAVVHQSFRTETEQDAWIANQIRLNLTHDELEHDDILVVLPDTYRAKSRAPRLMGLLNQLGIGSHLVGVNTSLDTVFVPGSVAIAHIHRAKGNEAPMVYVVDAQYASLDYNAVTRRNTLFTAITRSRAWVRITGWGDRMEAIEREIREVVEKGFRLEFPIPTEEELRRIRHFYRDRSKEEEKSIRRAAKNLEAFVDVLERDGLDIEDLPEELRIRLARMLGEDRQI